jgi:D-arabinose 1-dehydrogenase-like Zn-dependent alcohol dehydrogenase
MSNQEQHGSVLEAEKAKVKPMIETFSMKEPNKAFDHVRAGKARYRAVLAV